MKRLILMAAVALICAGAAQAKNLKTKVFHITPAMECSNCENRVTDCIRNEAGVDNVSADRKTQTVTVCYDADTTTPENIAQALAKINYKATDGKICAKKSCENYGNECTESCTSCQHPCGSGCAEECTGPAVRDCTRSCGAEK